MHTLSPEQRALLWDYRRERTCRIRAYLACSDPRFAHLGDDLIASAESTMLGSLRLRRRYSSHEAWQLSMRRYADAFAGAVKWLNREVDEARLWGDDLTAERLVLKAHDASEMHERHAAFAALTEDELRWLLEQLGIDRLASLSWTAADPAWRFHRNLARAAGLHRCLAQGRARSPIRRTHGHEPRVRARRHGGQRHATKRQSGVSPPADDGPGEPPCLARRATSPRLDRPLAARRAAG